MSYLLVLVKFNEGVEVRGSDLIEVLSAAPMSVNECQVLKSKQSANTLNNPKTLLSIIEVSRYVKLVFRWIASRPKVLNGCKVVNDPNPVPVASQLVLKDAERAYWLLKPIYGNGLAIEVSCDE